MQKILFWRWQEDPHEEKVKNGEAKTEEEKEEERKKKEEKEKVNLK